MQYRVGRRTEAGISPAFKIEPIGNGGVRITDSDLSGGEQALILAHYGRELRGRVAVRSSVGDEQHIRLFRPGTAHHFDQASHQLPEPFRLLPRVG